MLTKPELIAPAGDLEKLKIAFQYGADSVYASTPKFSMRTREISFTHESLAEGIAYAHNLGKKVYLTLNIYPHSSQIPDMLAHADITAALKPDAIIVADPGIFQYMREQYPDISLHLSTQANTTNHLTANFWHKLGADRVVLAREMSMEDIKIAADNSPIHLECFVHGSMCMAYSGRCQISNYMTGRDPNQGVCAQACRYKYTMHEVTEEKRPDEQYPVYEDEHGTYIFNSKDLCMINHISELVAAGVDSFKIEGRLKSQYYLASVVRAYRAAIDLYFEDPAAYAAQADERTEEMAKVASRSYTTGSFFHKPNEESNNYETTRTSSDWIYAAIVTDYNPETGQATLAGRNQLFFEDSPNIEIITPNGIIKQTVTSVIKDDISVSIVNPNDIVLLTTAAPVEVNCFVRMEKRRGV
jgi:putative protease